MQTTLRIRDELYRRAKAEAARQGVTLTQFIEEALAMRLARPAPGEPPVELPSYRGGPDVPKDFNSLTTIEKAEKDTDSQRATRLLNG